MYYITIRDFYTFVQKCFYSRNTNLQTFNLLLCLRTVDDQNKRIVTLISIYCNKKMILIAFLMRERSRLFGTLCTYVLVYIIHVISVVINVTYPINFQFQYLLINNESKKIKRKQTPCCEKKKERKIHIFYLSCKIFYNFLIGSIVLI